MIITVVAVLILAVVVIVHYFQYETTPPSPEVELQTLKELGVRHDLHTEFMTLVNDEGAGSWPPRATHDNFPQALRPFQEVYAKMSPRLATANPSLDDEYNKVRCREFRMEMQELLNKLIDVKAARAALEEVEAGKWDAFPRDAFNGFYSCIACLRHAYRWATNPVVKIAQEEKHLDFPPELDMAWSFVQRRFDITSPSGNIMANAVCNFDSQGQIAYPVNEGMSAAVLSTELAWNRIFYDTEAMVRERSQHGGHPGLTLGPNQFLNVLIDIQAIPLYYAMIRAVVDFERGNKSSAWSHIHMALKQLRKVMQNLYEKMHDSHVARPIWVRHVSGIHSWGLTLESDITPIEYGGLSGSQILVFLAVDAFLGIERYHSDEELRMHIPRNMRDVAACFGKHSFRRRLSDKSGEDVAIAKELDRMVKQLRSFRAVHKVRAVRYLSAPAPERIPMTAALSVLPGPGEEVVVSDSYGAIEGMLIKRLKETV